MLGDRYCSRIYGSVSRVGCSQGGERPPNARPDTFFCPRITHGKVSRTGRIPAVIVPRVICPRPHNGLPGVLIQILLVAPVLKRRVTIRITRQRARYNFRGTALGNGRQTRSTKIHRFADRPTPVSPSRLFLEGANRDFASLYRRARDGDGRRPRERERERKGEGEARNPMERLKPRRARKMDGTCNLRRYQRKAEPSYRLSPMLERGGREEGRRGSTGVPPEECFSASNRKIPARRARGRPPEIFRRVRPREFNARTL